MCVFQKMVMDEWALWPLCPCKGPIGNIKHCGTSFVINFKHFLKAENVVRQVKLRIQALINILIFAELLILSDLQPAADPYNVVCNSKFASIT